MEGISTSCVCWTASHCEKSKSEWVVALSSNNLALWTLTWLGSNCLAHIFCLAFWTLACKKICRSRVSVRVAYGLWQAQKRESMEGMKNTHTCQWILQRKNDRRKGRTLLAYHFLVSSKIELRCVWMTDNASCSTVRSIYLFMAVGSIFGIIVHTKDIITLSLSLSCSIIEARKNNTTVSYAFYVLNWRRKHLKIIKNSTISTLAS